ncbi:MAG: D-alanyl-D-alanine carboxypeptidase family protein [Wenzhouxiangella sp.]|nr:MAG: D-alanyl-D-alanine carboxypeptidase family protein [Wenzhouxiangella sp.]
MELYPAVVQDQFLNSRRPDFQQRMARRHDGQPKADRHQHQSGNGRTEPSETGAWQHGENIARWPISYRLKIGAGCRSCRRPMTQNASIQLARMAELGMLGELIRTQLPDVVHAGPSKDTLQRQLSYLIEDGCLITARHEGRYHGVVALDLLDGRVTACYLDPALADATTPRRLMQAAEKRALMFGLRKLECCVRAPALRFMRSIGFELAAAEAAASQAILVTKQLEENAPAWIKDVFALHGQLGIPDDYGARHRLVMVPDARNLDSIGFDVYDREQWLTPEAAKSWRKMHETAVRAGVELQVVSAFRSRKYQAGLIRGKLDKGQTINRILSVSAAPGFSEHHSGRALDLKCPGEPPVEESFARTRAYRWLKANARYFGFQETFPQSNRHGIIWEPWHWCFRPSHSQAS